MIDHQLAKSSIAVFEEMLKGKTSCSEQPYKHELLACLKTAKCFNSWGSSTYHREVPIADTKQETQMAYRTLKPKHFYLVHDIGTVIN